MRGMKGKMGQRAVTLTHEAVAARHAAALAMPKGPERTKELKRVADSRRRLELREALDAPMGRDDA